MRIELIAIGDEVLYGYTVNTNASFIGKALIDAGFSLARQTVVGDEPKALQDALKEALLRKSFVIICGGLGPTCDDYTRQVVSELLQMPLQFNQKIFDRLQERYGDHPTLKNQATQPVGAQLFENTLGTAYGFLVQKESFPGSFLFALPGVPSELRDMVQRYLIPLLQEKFAESRHLFIKSIHLMGLALGEAEVDPLLREISAKYPEVHCGIYPAYGTLTVHLKAKATSDAEFLQIIQEPLIEFEKHFQDKIFVSPSGTIEEALHLYLLDKKITLATAESCTGGALAARFVSFAGASTYFKGSIVAYSNEIKEKLLHVSPKTLQTAGAVSEEVTQEMAQGSLKDFQTDLAIAASGILGPTGATPNKPVGTVCYTIAHKDGFVHSWTKRFTGNREIIMERAIINIVSELYRILTHRIGKTHK
jgi:nicotinamide-nucleotide amidase